MTNHWIDLKNADAFLIMGSNTVENHPIASRWIWTAKEKNNATIIHVDPRFTRTSAKADIYAPIRSGTDIVFLGGMIRWMINKWETDGTCINVKYTEDCTNALYKILATYEGARHPSHPGNFSANTTWNYQYATPDYTPAAPASWLASTSYNAGPTGTISVVSPTTPNNFRYECIASGTSGGTEPTWPTAVGGTVTDGTTVIWRCCPPNAHIQKPLKAANLTAAVSDPDTVFYKLKEHYSIYTPAVVEEICGTPQALFEQICQSYIGGTYADNKAGTMLYAMGWTQHTVGTQNIRCATIIQSLLGNIGVAGGGVDALRGWHNVQGATDHGLLQQYLPGYLGAPTNTQAHANLGVGPLDPVSTYPNGTYLKGAIPIAMDPDAPTAPQSSNWWGMFANQYNRARYMVSLLKAWWPTTDHNTSWSYLPKKSGDCSYLSLITAINSGVIKGIFTWGTNPLVMGPDQNFERPAFDKLSWLVCCDLFETETATFWKRPGLTPAQIAAIPTEVYLLPGAAYFEKEGSASNSGRLMQWRDKACTPPGDAKDEIDIVNDLGAAIKALYAGSGLPKDAGIENLAWPVGSTLTGTSLADKVAKECNGYALVNFNTPVIAGAITSYTAGQQLNSFFHLMSGGETACGNWLFTGTYQKTANARTTNLNQMKNRRAVDDHPSAIGIYRDWGYAWPLNRRIIYNRAAVYQSAGGAGALGTPLAGTVTGNKWVCWWNGTNWEGGCGTGQANDVADGFGTAGPATWLPYIMREEGVARLMSVKTGMADGPLPEHWEPKETPLTANPLTNGAGPLSSPYAFAYAGRSYATAGDPNYPIVATTYRLTEHWHGGGLTRNCPTQCELMPEPFIEMSVELAAAKGIINGDDVLVSSIRGSITVKACVTKRWKPFIIDGQTIHEVGLPWHWGWAALCSGESANVLTPFIGDANTRIPETKVFLVNIAKA